MINSTAHPQPFKILQLFFVLLIFAYLNVSAQIIVPYQNPHLTAETRVSDLLSRMTLEEKIGQMTMLSLRNLKTDENEEVIQKSLEKLFDGNSIGWLESIPLF